MYRYCSSKMGTYESCLMERPKTSTDFRSWVCIMYVCMSIYILYEYKLSLNQSIWGNAGFQNPWLTWSWRPTSVYQVSPQCCCSLPPNYVCKNNIIHPPKPWSTSGYLFTRSTHYYFRVVRFSPILIKCPPHSLCRELVCIFLKS